MGNALSCGGEVQNGSKSGLPCGNNSRESRDKKGKGSPLKTAPTFIDVSENLDSEDEHEVVDDENLPVPSANYDKTNRLSVSAEAYGKYNKMENFKPPFSEKSPQQRERIEKLLQESFLFKALTGKEKNIVVGAFFEERITAGTRFIIQGDAGYKLYLLDKGEVEVLKSIGGQPEVHMCELGPGDVVGELALMYNSNRAATALAKTDVVAWTLDRKTFSCIVRDAAAKKREQYDELLSKVVLLSEMDPYERSKVADALEDKEFEEGTILIQEGDPGDEFFMLVEGKAEAYKGEYRVAEYNEGSYFGELSLIRSQPRAATVKCITKCRVLTLSRKSFKRLLGPVEHILQRNLEHYKMVLKSLHLSTYAVDPIQTS